jgi:phosphoglycolate phosphatase
MTHIRDFIFDWSGTLVDDLPPVIDATNAVLGHYGKPPVDRAEFLATFELPFQKYYDRVLPGCPLAELEPLFHAAFARSQATASILPDTRAFLDFCQQRQARCFILSSAHPDHLMAQAEEFSLTPYFEKIYAGIRDKTHFIHQLLHQHQLDPATTAFIGDMTHDIETAHHAQLTSVAVLTGYQNAEQLTRVNPHLMVDTLAHLRAHLA